MLHKYINIYIIYHIIIYDYTKYYLLYLYYCYQVQACSSSFMVGQ